ncbi:hypothetical protein ABQZ69_05620 [Xanthomonas sp. WHRI 8391]|uniref:Uncharacterized protein n=2 Tax=Xanthomonas hortorum TaxID=56454 RepID=A0A6V7C1X9_9XANT|nr:hypothetical protein [Xanthomonas hortorum]MBG3849423.1 hypothetical protein [Xanthomonas hortorum pv. carotae]UTS73825.1 hypothetical protein NMB96_02920 [Xanthomonas hortorum]WAH64957.1 hypothetical protein OEG85_02900 [Xanthomonas hortorum]CAD0308141.1 hypothetical protein CFBP7900_06160 [Xanthomonas hortorum pv. carotae]CAD0308146.1 hypothetical protein CFBP7900_06160 [Xanthomonas hortorum pv. carotae]
MAYLRMGQLQLCAASGLFLRIKLCRNSAIQFSVDIGQQLSRQERSWRQATATGLSRTQQRVKTLMTQAEGCVRMRYLPVSQASYAVFDSGVRHILRN